MLRTSVTPYRASLAPFLLILALVLTACGTNPYSLPKVETGEPAGETTDPAPQPPAPKPESPPPESATSANNALLARAEEARSEGDYDRALAYLERAQRIDPDDAGVYLALAQTHDAAGNSSQAKAVAERGLLYCQQQKLCDALRAYTR